MSVLEAISEERRPWGRRGSRSGESREEALLDALLQGDREAAERLAEETYQRIFAALFRMCGEPELAADLTQETYRKAWCSLGSFRRGARFSTWLYRIAYTTFLNHLRRPARVRPLADGEAEALAEPGDDQESEAAGHELARRLRRLVVALPEDLRFAVTARYWGEVPVREIALAEGVTATAVRKRLDKAVATLRNNLRPNLTERT